MAGGSCPGGCYGGCLCNCYGGCGSGCYGTCRGCGSGCASTCSGSCSGSCSGGCSGSCSGSCSGCSGSCKGGCSGDCDGGCSGCGSGCSGGCSGSCKNRCTGSCNNLCNTACGAADRADFIKAIGSGITPDGIMIASKVKEVKEAIVNEFTRRSRAGYTSYEIQPLIDALVRYEHGRKILDDVYIFDNSKDYRNKISVEFESADASDLKDAIAFIQQMMNTVVGVR